VFAVYVFKITIVVAFRLLYYLYSINKHIHNFIIQFSCSNGIFVEHKLILVTNC